MGADRRWGRGDKPSMCPLPDLSEKVKIEKRNEYAKY
jgi:hypothetical protein